MNESYIYVLFGIVLGLCAFLVIINPNISITGNVVKENIYSNPSERIDLPEGQICCQYYKNKEIFYNLKPSYIIVKSIEECFNKYEGIKHSANACFE